MGQRHVRILLAIFILALALKLLLSTQVYLIHNNDAGYYVKNINEVLQHGYPSASAPPLPFYYAAIFSSVLGVMLGFKVAIALASAGIAFPVYRITEHVAKNKDAALLAAFLAAFSPTNMFMMGDLLKNMCGLFFGMWFVYYLINTTDRFTVRDAALAAASALLMIGSHLSSSAYSMLAVAPFLLIFPAYGYWRKRKLSKESLFSLAMAGMLFLAGSAVILLRGMDVSEGKVGIVGLYGAGDTALVLLDGYGFFLIPVFLGFSRLGRERLMLFLPWLAVAFLLTQPYFASEAWTFRFAWNTYPLVAILSAVGIFHFQKQKAALYGLVAILVIHTLGGFVASGQATHPVLETEEWEGMLKLRAERPDIQLINVGGPMGYWAEAAGLSGSDRPDPEPHFLLCDGMQFRENEWLDFSCRANNPISREEIVRLESEGKVAASFGRFIVVAERDYELPVDMIEDPDAERDR
jgi:hypothetical protein